jgi:predicted transcriptional regulator of viral defense system
MADVPPLLITRINLPIFCYGLGMKAEIGAHENPLEQVMARLTRAAHLAGRPGVAVLDRDLESLDEFTGDRQRSHAMVDRLERIGRLRRVRRGAYVLVGQDGTLRVGLLDLIAAITPRPYLVTAGRALEFHDLTDQHFRRAIVATATQLRSWTWRGEEVRYARVRADHVRTTPTRTRRTRARIASPERAILDGLGHPHWGVTLPQVVRAMDLALKRHAGFADRLAAEASALGNAALARRAGFLVTRLAGPEAARPFRLLLGQSKAITPLRPGGRANGPVDGSWRIRDNVGLELLMSERGSGLK